MLDPRAEETGPDADPSDEPPEPPALRRLRWMTSALMAVLILGMVAVSGAIVIGVGRLSSGGEAAALAPVTAAEIALPQGHAVLALGRSEGEVLVLTRGPDGAETLRAIDAATGRLRSATPIARIPSGGGDQPAR